MTDPILQLVQLTTELWNEKKGLAFTIGRDKVAKKRQLIVILKLIKKIQALELVREVELLCELNGVDKTEVMT